jgi:hypothetical protein
MSNVHFIDFGTMDSDLAATLDLPLTLPEQFLDELIKGKAEADAEIARLTTEGLANTKLFYQTMCAVRCLDKSIEIMTMALNRVN